MTSTDTREFMALMAIAQHHGRPGTPTDQAHVESFYSHLKGDWPHLVDIRDPAVLDTELARVRTEYNTVRLHAGIGYVTPDDEHHGRGPAIRRARAAGLKRAHQHVYGVEVAEGPVRDGRGVEPTPDGGAVTALTGASAGQPTFPCLRVALNCGTPAHVSLTYRGPPLRRRSKADSCRVGPSSTFSHSGGRRSASS
jgi:hypothetical protein